LNPNGNEIIIKGKEFTKTIELLGDGSFSDTLRIPAEKYFYSFSDGNEYTSLFLRNGYNLNLNLNTLEFDESIRYTGKGSVNNNYLAQKYLLQEQVYSDESIFNLQQRAFKEKITQIEKEFIELLENVQGIDTNLIADEQENRSRLIQRIKQEYSRKILMGETLAEGMDSPKFANYENYNGKTTSLDDLQGRYVYIDIWATWCEPCKAEIPFLKKLEDKYHEKKIAFISISIDSEKDHNIWKEMVAEKELSGIQLFSDKDWNSEFIKNYLVNSIPRFILIDPEGKIISADAPRPSQREIISILLNQLEI
jgi:thiol-disulfide isomerase/thioredoxin